METEYKNLSIALNDMTFDDALKSLNEINFFVSFKHEYINRNRNIYTFFIILNNLYDKGFFTFEICTSNRNLTYTSFYFYEY